MTRAALLFPMLVLAAAWSGPATAQEPDLAAFFGFDALEIVKIGDGAGPVTMADMNGDDHLDLVIVNNRASRLEVHLQKPGAVPTEITAAPSRVNEFPEHWRFRRLTISVPHRVSAVVAHDFDGDGLNDLIYAGLPEEVVFVRQSAPGRFEVTRRHRVRNLSATRSSFAVADVVGDRSLDLLALADGRVQIWPLLGDRLGRRTELAAGQDLVAFCLADFNGDGRLDVAGAIPDDAAPVRLWLGAVEGDQGVFGAQLRFEMPGLLELEPVHLPDEPADRLAVIERASKRIVIHTLASEPIESRGDRAASLDTFSFTDPENRKRDHAVIDVDGDGRLDVVATDTEANTLVVYRQLPGRGLRGGRSYPGLSDVTYIAAGNVDDDPYAELFVLSEKEEVVGRVDATSDGLPFPVPIALSDGYSPVALALVRLEGGPRLAVIAKSGRNYVVELIDMANNRRTIELGAQSRAPETIVALDADQDGRTDLLLFTRDKPMTMLHAEDDGFKLLESKEMGQFGLVQAASAENTAIDDIDGNGKPELLIADKNFVRAVRYDPAPSGAASPGWQVVMQINTRDSTSKLVSLAWLGRRIVAADGENDRLVIFGLGTGDEEATWQELESVSVDGFSFNRIHAGAFSGDEQENILAVGNDGFAVIRLAGQRVVLRQTDAWRTEDEQRRQHELTAGDVNSDGFTDLVSLDAGEQMCEIFTFTESGSMLYATGFQVFESKIFSGGEPREYEPSDVLIGDITGDGAADLVLLAHDRVLIYPQMVARDAGDHR